MVFGLFRKSAPVLPPATVPDGSRVYAIGDVHGRLDLLRTLIALIDSDNAARGPAETTVIMLGDFIDRGPHSSEVIDYLVSGLPLFAGFRFLKGNHEEAMLKSLTNGGNPRQTGWLRFGGWETLESYGVPESVLDHFSGEALAEEICRYVPTAHLDFLHAGEDSVRLGDYLFVHAGIRPGVALDEQRPADLRWIRESFLDDDTYHGAVIVHGHTISETPEFRANRIGIDTGAYDTGVLTALGLEGTDRWTLATEPAQ